MALVAVSRWKGNVQDLSLAKEIAPVLKRAGAVSVRIDNCYAGAYAGQNLRNSHIRRLGILLTRRVKTAKRILRD